MKKRFWHFNPTYTLIALIFLALIFFGALVAVVVLKVSEEWIQAIIIALSFLPTAGIFGSWMVIFYVLKWRRQNVIKSFDIFAESLIPASGVGVIMFDDTGLIYWTSRFINPRIERKLIGKRISTISEDFKIEHFNDRKVFQFTFANSNWEARVYADSKIIVMRDITNESTLLKLYADEKYVLGELEVDNLQQLQAVLPEEAMFKVQTQVVKIVDELTDSYNIAYRQYVTGKYLLIANQEALDKLMATEFNFLTKIREQRFFSDMRVTISIGWGAGLGTQKELLEHAREALALAQTRGGDQVVVVENNKKPRYFGARLDSAKVTSRVRIKQVAEHFESRLYDKKIKRVIIYGHAHADLDAIGSALGIYDFARALDKEAYIQNWTFDLTTSGVLATLDKSDINMFIRPTRASALSVEDSTIVVIVDTADTERIENPAALENINPSNVFVFDHHRVARLPKTIPNQNIYIDTSASSASEIVTELLQFSATAIKPTRLTAQMMLNGIYLDTTGFTKAVSSRTFAAAAWLENVGAQSSIAVNVMKLPEQYETLIRSMLNNVREVRPGYFLTTSDEEVPQEVVSIVADEMMRVQNRQAVFVVARVPNEKKYKLSARGINVNVQTIAEAVGGGGGFSSAAAESTEPLQIFVDNIVQAIISARNSNTSEQNLEQMQTGGEWK